MGDVVGSIAGAAIGASGAKSAAKTQAKAADRATAVENARFEEMRTDLKPYRNAGEGATNRLTYLLGTTPGSGADYGSLMRGFTGADLEQDPGYQFELDQGNQSLDRRAAAGGNYFSGAALKAAQRYGQDYAGTKFNEAFNRDNTTKSRAMNFLSSVANLGQTAATQTGQAGMTAGNRAADNIIGAGNASAAGTVGAYNAFGNAINQYQSNQNQRDLIDSLNGKTSNNSLYSAMNSGGWGFSNGSDSWG